MKNKEILICDDQDIFIEKFKKNHNGAYTINVERDITNVLNRINEHLPDIVLLDLYHPKDNLVDFNIRKLKAEEELKKLDVQIDITKEAVESAWEPLGLEILEDIRKHFDAKQLPVIIYTQRGFSLVLLPYAATILKWRF
jgi:CheY-like chemotaxis protein